MATRMAVMALRNAADARMKTSSVMRLSHSSLSRIVMGMLVHSSQSSVFQVKKSKPETGRLRLKTAVPVKVLTTENYFFASGGAGYSGNLSLLGSARFTSSSSNSSDGLITVVGTPTGRVLTNR